VFVVAIRPETNEVVLGHDKDVFTDHLIADRVNFMADEEFEPAKTYLGKIRYSHAGTPCHVTMLDKDKIRVDFVEPVRAVTPGQALVLYPGDYVAGGGTII
jgi:tRNA-specific 2-thiouridylase